MPKTQCSKLSFSPFAAFIRRERALLHCFSYIISTIILGGERKEVGTAETRVCSALICTSRVYPQSTYLLYLTPTSILCRQIQESRTSLYNVFKTHFGDVCPPRMYAGIINNSTNILSTISGEWKKGPQRSTQPVLEAHWCAIPPCVTSNLYWCITTVVPTSQYWW